MPVLRYRSQLHPTEGYNGLSSKVGEFAVFYFYFGDGDDILMRD